MNRAVKHVQLHAVPFVEGCGQLKSILSVSNYPGMKMSWTAEGVIVDYKTFSFILPLANIIVATFTEPTAERHSAPKPLEITLLKQNSPKSA